MSRAYRRPISVYLRRIAAAAFLLFLLAEWGAHVSVHINTPQAAEAAVGDNSGHPDDHGPLMLCNDTGQRDLQVPNSPHDLSPTAGMPYQGLDLAIAPTDQPVPLPARTTVPLSRPPDPHFRPPETA